MTDDSQSGDNAAATLLADVADLVSDDRDSHGDAVENQEHIAEAWNWYLQGHGIIDEEAIDGGDVARMMELLKLSRACVGEYDVDHDRDVAGYAGIAAACEVEAGNADRDELEVAGDG
ncbi:hypothetical protein OSG_eHP32_00190 [environmental Halophage eHP-32]|nr:hypothetical protein OSG_eHP32_00190 [environmental Halophage eHP-32]